MGDNERRRDIRTPITVPARIVRRGGDEPVQVIDASYRGLLLRVSQPLPMREMLRVRVQLPSCEVDLHVVVVRLVHKAPGRCDVGFRFFALNGQDKSDWEAFISHALATRAKAA